MHRRACSAASYPFLRNTKLEVELRQSEMGRKTVRLQLGRRFQMVDGRIDIARQGVGDPKNMWPGAKSGACSRHRESAATAAAASPD